MTAPALGFSSPGQSLQRERRGYHDEFTDGHERKFAAQYDLGNQRPIGELQPVGFNPPWLPPMRFLKWERHGSFRFRWDYVAMANELASDTAAYYQDAVKFAIEHNKPEPELGGPVDRSIRYALGPPPLSPAIPMAAEEGDPWILGVPGAPVNKLLKAILEQGIGASSKEALQFIRASLVKLVGRDAVPHRKEVVLDPVLTAPKSTRGNISPALVDAVTEFTADTTYAQFVKTCSLQRMRMPDIIQAWRDHRQAIDGDKFAARDEQRKRTQAARAKWRRDVKDAEHAEAEKLNARILNALPAIDGEPAVNV